MLGNFFKFLTGLQGSSELLPSIGPFIYHRNLSDQRRRPVTHELDDMAVDRATTEATAPWNAEDQVAHVLRMKFDAAMRTVHVAPW